LLKQFGQDEMPVMEAFSSQYQFQQSAKPLYCLCQYSRKRRKMSNVNVSRRWWSTKVPC